MRGKAFEITCKIILFRITPAYAGKSPLARSRRNNEKDHPRLCGEKFVQSSQRNIFKGSPPPMRGKVILNQSNAVRFGITPAYAGKSVFEFRVRGFDRDHPRLCGEKLRSDRIQSLRQGSPPPMRGKDASWKCLLDCKGITPAYAGKRLCRFRSYLQKWDHPRLCGEKTKKILKQRYFFHQPASFSFSLQYT